MFMNKGGVSWLVVFLGNPGLKYNGTRHNAGFMAADAMEKKLGVKINRMRFRALTQTVDIGGQKVMLMKPQTYMNLSGDAVNASTAFTTQRRTAASSAPSHTITAPLSDSSALALPTPSHCSSTVSSLCSSP